MHLLPCVFPIIQPKWVGVILYLVSPLSVCSCPLCVYCQRFKTSIVNVVPTRQITKLNTHVVFKSCILGFLGNLFSCYTYILQFSTPGTTGGRWCERLEIIQKINNLHMITNRELGSAGQKKKAFRVRPVSPSKAFSLDPKWLLAVHLDRLSDHPEITWINKASGMRQHVEVDITTSVREYFHFYEILIRLDPFLLGCSDS